MSSNNEVSKGVQNLQAIKSGEDPRAPEVQEQNREALDVLKEYIDGLYDQYEWLSGELPRSKITVCTAYWDRLRGRCYNNRVPKTDKRNFGKAVRKKTHFRERHGRYIVVVNRALIEAKDEETNWHDTARHELAHALQREKYPRSSSHGERFRECARRLGAKPKANHSIRPERVKHLKRR